VPDSKPPVPTARVLTVRTITVPAEIAATELQSSLMEAIAPTAVVQLITFLVQTGPVAACRVPAPLEPTSRVLICRVPLPMLIRREQLLRVRAAVLGSIVLAATAERIIFQGQIGLAQAAAKRILSISTPTVLAAYNQVPIFRAPIRLVWIGPVPVVHEVVILARAPVHSEELPEALKVVPRAAHRWVASAGVIVGPRQEPLIGSLVTAISLTAISLVVPERPAPAALAKVRFRTTCAPCATCNDVMQNDAAVLRPICVRFHSGLNRPQDQSVLTTTTADAVLTRSAPAQVLPTAPRAERLHPVLAVNQRQMLVQDAATANVDQATIRTNKRIKSRTRNSPGCDLVQS